jgi:hypothetical protein
MDIRIDLPQRAVDHLRHYHVADPGRPDNEDTAGFSRHGESASSV